MALQPQQAAGQTAQVTPTPAAAPDVLAQLESNVASAIANEPEKQFSATGGEILPNPGSDEEHENNKFNKGQELAVQMERERLAHNAQIQNLTNQSAQQLGAIQQRLDDAMTQINNLSQNTPQNRQVSPQEKYQLSQEELAEIEPTQSAIEKLAAMKAEETTNAAVQQVLNAMQQQEKKYMGIIEEMKATQTLQSKTTQSNYDTVVYNTGIALGLDTTSLPQDREFQEFLTQKESPYRTTTLHDVVIAAEKSADSQATAKILKAYADHKAQQMGNNTGTPHGLSQPGIGGVPGGGNGAGMAGQQQALEQDSPEVRMQNQRALIQTERRRLNEEMALRTIDPDKYRADIQKLDQLDSQLITALYNGAGAATG